MLRFLERLIVAAFLRIEGRANQTKVRLASEQLRSRANLDATTVLGAAAHLVNNRSEVSAISVGSNCFINGQLIVFPGRGKITIGNRCFLGEGSRIWSAAEISIGNNVLISHNVNIHDCNGHSKDWKDRRDELTEILPHMRASTYDHEIGASSISIGDDVWIGFNSTIRPGVVIGDRSIIGCNTLVTKDVPSGTIVVGNPQKCIGQVEV